MYFKANYYRWVLIKKLLLFMQITTILLFSASLTATAGSHAQSITISANKVKLEKIFREIKKQTNYVFFYDAGVLRDAKPVSIHIKNASIEEVLKESLQDQPLDFSIEKETITIFKKAGNSLDKNPTVGALVPLPPLLNEIKGIVKDEKGNPLAGVSVILKGTKKGTSTGTDGSFSIDANVGDVLEFSIVGYREKSVTVGQNINISVVMEIEAAMGNEIVLVGYGIQKKENVTGSIVSIQAKDIENPSIANPYQAMEGKLPGLQVTQQTGQPGAEVFNLNIRGPNSFSSDNSPLVLIDGVVGNLNELDPSFIATITVLKDASSASIYGARASNGVILVTTKTGENNAGLHVQYTGSYVNQSKINWPKRVWNSVQYMTMWDTAAVHAGSGNNNYTPDIIDLYRTPSLQYPSFNWENFMIKPINIFKHSLSIGGHSGNTNYHAAMGEWNQDGIVTGFNYKKYTGMFNMESQLSKRFKIGITTNGIVDKEKEPYNGGSDEITSTINQNPDYEPYLSDGSGRYAWGALPFEHPQKSPIAAAENGGHFSNNFAFNGTAYTQLNILDNLTWEVKGGISHSENDLKVQVPVIPIYNYLTNNFAGNDNGQGQITLSEMNTKNDYYTIYSTLNYTKTILHDYHINALVGISQEKSDNNYIQGFRSGFASSSLDVLSAGPALGQTTGGNETEYALRSIFGRLNFNYKNKYLFEANLRRDGSSRFPPINKYAFFPSFSAGWLINKEPFIANNWSWLSEFKIRASYGKLGNDNVNGNNYPYQAVLSTGASYPFANAQDGVILNSLNNNQLKWESTNIQNLGLDVNIKNSLLYATFDYFIKNTSGIIRSEQIPIYAGLAGPIVNEGEVQNKGYEFVLGHKYHIGELRYDAEFNISAYKNKVLKFGAPEYGATSLLKEGYEMNQYYMYESNGIYQSQAAIDKGPTTPWVESPGDVSIKDVNGDGKITPDDRVPVKGAYPNYYFGFSLNASWKGFNIGVFFQGVQGKKIAVIASNNNGVLPFSGGVPLVWWENAWTPQNHSTTIPKMDWYGGPLGASTRQISTFWLDDASYTRLKNVTVGYTLPASFTRKFHVQKFNVFFSGENLFTFTKYKFGDPESVGGLTYPMLRSLTLGVNVQF